MQEDWKPKVDMFFDSLKDAWKFWVDYGGKVGFGVRRQYAHTKNDGSISSCRFVYCKEGLRKPDIRDYKTINPRPETNCQARLGLKNICGKLIVHEFVEEHNHILHLQETTHMLSSQRKLSEAQCHQIDLADDAGLQQRKSFDLMSKEVGEQFEEGWRTLLVKYDVQENTWLQRVYTIKEKWASCYMKKAFTLGMQSTQLKKKRYNELKCEYEARQKVPRLKNPYSYILQQVSELYTPTIFDLFQNEYELFEACSVKSINVKASSIDYVIAMLVPEQYILKRIATEACNYQESFMFLRKVVDELDKHMLEFRKRQVSTTQDNEFLSKGIEIASTDDCSTQVKGFKKREGKKGSKRMKGWVERQLSRKKKNGDPSASQSQEPTTNNEGKKSLTCMKWWIEKHVTSQEPAMENNVLLSQIGVNSFTSLLMAQLDEDYTTLTKP
ncbi:FAR1 DNA-binding domain [Sesbania bispinosa]|nr:FAR1 DNA-binding domain [Sesbania bispinosa]